MVGKISEMTAASAAALLDELETNQAGTTRKLTIQQILDAINVLADAGSLVDADKMAVTQSGVAKDVALSVLKTYMAGNDPRLITKELTSDATSSSITMAKATGLDQSVGIGTWWFEYRCIWQSTATATAVKFGVNFSGTQTLYFAEATGYEATTAASTGAQLISSAFGLRAGGQQRAPSTTVALMGPISIDVANANHMAIIKGVIKVTVTGDLQLYFGSEATGSTQTLKAGTALRMTKVSA